MKHRTLCFALILVVLTLSPLSAQEAPPGNVQSTETVKDTIVTKNPNGAMLRSLIVPGWGQFYNGQWLKGVAVAGAEIGLVTNAIVLNQWANTAATEEERLYYLDNRNLSFWILGAVILYSMADAYVDAALFDFDESPELSFDVLPQRDPVGGIAGTYRINLCIRL